MVSSTFILTPGISLTLPEASSAEPTVMTRLVVTIAEEDQIYLNKEQYSLETLEEALQQFSQREELREIQTVVVEGDQSVSYSLMVRVLDTLRQHGFEGVNLRMREED